MPLRYFLSNRNADGKSMKGLAMNGRHFIFWLAITVFNISSQGVIAAPRLEKGATVTAADPATPVEFHVYMPLRNQAALETLLKEQHTEGSSQYHVWLTPEQFATQFGPTPASVSNVKAALRNLGLKITAEHTRSLRVAGDALHAGKLLGASFDVVKGPSGARRIVTRGASSLPPSLQAEGVKIIAFAPLPAKRTTAVKQAATPLTANRYSAVGPYWFTDLKQAYSYPAYSKNRSDGAGTSVAVLMSDLTSPDDLASVFNNESFTAITHLPTPTFETVMIDGGGTLGGPGSFEMSTDVQQVLGGAPAVRLTQISLPDLSDGSIIHGLTHIVDTNAYDIVNMSFYACELLYTAAYNAGVDFTWILQAEHELFQQGNAQGITFVAASGDWGGKPCPSADYFSGDPSASPTFVPGVSSPANDPNVTAVGGGNLVTSPGPGLNSSYVRENGIGDPLPPYDPYNLGLNVSGGFWGAGGGISTIFPKPPYQYLVNTGSELGRAIPDVGMQVGGLGTSPDESAAVTVFGSVPYGVVGTSVSSPEFVSALALYKQRVGRRVGNVNFLLYLAGASQTRFGGASAPPGWQLFHRGMREDDGVFHSGFPTPNYDYVYGNGSPNVVKLFGLSSYGLAGTPQTATNP
jgi:subtilase family serine protease